MKNVFVFILTLLFFLPTFAADNLYKFNNTYDEHRFILLISELRCLVCQNQNLAESNAPLAYDLRQQIYQKIKRGESNKVIIDYLVSRYGYYILYNPPFDLFTLGLWWGPFIFLLMGLGYLIFYIRLK